MLWLFFHSFFNWCPQDGTELNDSNVARSNTQDPLFFRIQAPLISGSGSRQCCGSGMFIPDSNFSIPDPGWKWYPDPHQSVLSIFTQKILSNLSEIWSGLFIPDLDLDFYPSLVPDPGSRGQKGTGNRFNFWDINSYKQGKDNQFIFSLFYFGFGMEKIRIRNKYPGSTTLVGLISDFERNSWSKLAKNMDLAIQTVTVFYVNNRELGKNYFELNLNLAVYP